MSSNINPEMRGTIDIKPFKMWCQKVLPQVYDDSLSYYEVLGKLVVYLNEVIENVETDGENVLTLHQAFLDLQTYVNEFFDDIGQLPDYVEQARTAATESQESATRSAQYAANSATSASNSADSALSAVQSANAASQSKDAAATSSQNAASYMQNALNSALDSEGWAVGTFGGVPVPPTNIHHENNSKWWASKSKEWYEYARDLIASLPENVDEILEMYQSLAPLRDSEELSGSIVTFESDFGSAPIKKVVVNVEPVQSGSGDPSPENIRPFTGWTGAKIVRTGENLWGGTVARDGIIAGVNRYDNSVENAVGIIYNASPVDFFTKDVKFKENTAYTFVLTGYNQGREYLNMLIYYTDGTFLRPEGFSTSKQTLAFVTNPNKTVAGIKKYNFDGTAFIFYNECGIFEGNITVNDFVPYKGEIYNIQFPTQAGTVYEFTLTINSDGSGEMVQTLYGKDLGALTWSKESTDAYTYFRANTSPQKIKSFGSYNAASCYKVVNKNRSALNNNELGFYNTNTTYYNVICVRDDRYAEMTAEEYKAAIAGQTYVYQLATPIKYNLTPAEVDKLITTLKGINNVWAEAGNITVAIGEYIETITENLANKIPINILTANVEKSYTASKNYAVNDFFVLNNTLYKVTDTIAQDGTITPNTNVVSTTIMDEITALLNA